jgi:hypothetical protein
MLDIDAKEKGRKEAYLIYARELAHQLAERIAGPVVLYDSGAGYWLVGLKRLSPDQWQKAYRWARSRGQPFDQIHVEASLKWQRTTLRVSRKGNGQQIKRLEYFDYPHVHTHND